MGDKHSLNYEVRELKLGASFTNNKASQYHTIKYDFKPASVDVSKMATVDVGTNNQVSVTVPHLDGAGVPQTVFKGNQRPYTKECVLIIDHVTGEFTLEKLSSNIQVKKTRQCGSSKPRPHTPAPPAPAPHVVPPPAPVPHVAPPLAPHVAPPPAPHVAPPHAPHVAPPPPPPPPTAPPAAPHPAPLPAMDTTQRLSSRTRVATNKRTYHQGNKQRPSGMVRSPTRHRSDPPQAVPWSGGGNSTLASLPMIGLEDLAGPAPPAPPAAHVPAPAPAPAPPVAYNGYPRAHERPPVHNTHLNNNQRRPEVVSPRVSPPRAPTPARAPSPRASCSSSSSSDSGSDSDSNSDSDEDTPQPQTNGASGRTGAGLPSDVLNDDLCLSESGSDSD